MNLLTKTAASALIATTVAWTLGCASAAPLSAPMALRDAITPTVETVQWRGGGWRGGWGGWRGGFGGRGVGVAAGALIGGALAGGPYYGYNYGYYASPCCSYYPTYYDDYAPTYYGGYSYAPYYPGYRYAPRFYGGYGLGYRHAYLRHRY